MIFATFINGIPCQCQVTHYAAPRAMHVYGSGFGDASPPEPEEFDFEILDRNSRPAAWLRKYINPAVRAQLLEEYRVMRDAEYYEHE